MRTFQFIYMVIFLVFYVSITLGAIKSLSAITNLKYREVVKWAISVVSVMVFVNFILLYIWPFTPRSSNNYSFHLIYNAILSIDFVFKIPLAVSYLAGIFVSIKYKPVIYYIGLIISFSLSASVIYGSVFGTKELVVHRQVLKFQNLPGSFNGYKILQISDTHLGNFLQSKKLMIKVKDENDIIKADIVLFTGDLVNNFANEVVGWSEIFNDITDDSQGYSILGNHDYGDYTNWESNELKKENFNQLVKAHNNFGLQLLNNEHVKLTSGTDSLYIIGVENWGHPPFPQYANLEKALNAVPKKSFKILMTHDPAHWDEIVKYRNDIDLTLSGHTHGLQWGIKKAGITFSLSYLTRKQWGGLYEYQNSKLYVNTGLGTVGIPWRINMPAEMTLFTLQRIEID